MVHIVNLIRFKMVEVLVEVSVYIQTLNMKKLNLHPFFVEWN